MVDVRGDVLRPPHGTAPAAVKSNIRSEMWSFKNNENIQKKDLRDIQVRMCKIFVIQGQVTPKWVVWSGPKSNLSELLCLSWLPLTLMMIWSKWTS